MRCSNGSAGLPSGWSLVTLAKITDDVKSCDPRKNPGVDFSYVDISSIDNERLEIVAAKTLRGSEAPSRARRPLQVGDVVFSNVRTYLRNVARVGQMAYPAVASTGFTVLRPNAHVLTDYLFRYVASDGFLRLVTPRQTGTHYPATSDRVVRQQLIPLPPVAEQRRIVSRLSEIEALRAATVTRVNAARTAVKSFRGAVLAAAATGRLTERWREVRSTPEWRTGVAAEICAKVQSGTTPKQWHTAAAGVPFLKVYNIVDQRLDFAYRPQFIAPDLHRGTMRRAVALPGDVLMNIVGPPLGKVAIVTEEYPEWSINQALTLFRPSELVTTDWLYVFLRSGLSVSAITGKTRGSVGQVNISLSQCREFQIPLPALDEQREIARRTAAMLAVADRLTSRLARIETDLDRSSQAAVAQAFGGGLAPSHAA